MTHEEKEYFRRTLTLMLDGISNNGKATIAELSAEGDKLADSTDWASSETLRSMACRLRDREHKMIRKIHEALQRIEEDTYGICEECGEPISTARLRARPVTTLCVECKSLQEEGESRGS
ncbi:DnaK suppressor protein [Desulfobaculum xiamenense]|uniref:DnaK suppressor protein n=1 Tax=Desulfobaculum xiamenense TaxID=995050 RepID=A0A846QPQ0_9BACT|nr:RNA polymerase-binding protein DksA [Desulfobaculum xiamenense]NJB68293.1 DnaK suppressor protein [Desulfobaculum xiamenense]